MNRATKILTMTAVAMSLLVGGCSKDEKPAGGWEADPDAVRVEASVGTVTKTSPLGTEDEQTKFSSGDRIAVAALDNSVGAVKKTVKYEFDDTSWSPVADGTGSTDYLVWDIPVTFRAWYPAGKSKDGSEFTLPGVQDGNMGYYTLADADFMTSEACTYSTLKDIPGDRTFKPVLKRRMALVTVIIDKVADEFDSVKDINVKVKNIYSAHSSVKLQSDGKFKSEGAAVSVSPYFHSIEGKSAYSAVVVPGDAADAETFLQVDVDGDDGYYQLVEVTGIRAAEAGKHYTYKLIVGKETVKVSGVTVVDWTSGGKVDGKFEAESATYSEWDGKTTDIDFDGEGTQDSPYLITSAAELAGLAKNVNAGTGYYGKYFRLETNIDLMGHEWTPIGDSKHIFMGYFDGNNNIITNMSISAAPTGSFRAGLFGNCQSASISGIVLKNARITCSCFAAGLICGELSGGAVKNCRVEGTINSKGDCGGIIGKVGVSTTSVSNCEVEIHCETTTGCAGGIVGSCSSGALTIESCTVKGEINGGNSDFGGVAGSLNGENMLVKKCTSYVKLGKAEKDKENVHPKVGGLIGSLYYGTVEDCIVYGCISFTDISSTIGGMFSSVWGVKLSNLSFRGDIDVTIIPLPSVFKTSIGAFIGYLDANRTTTASGCTYKKSGTGEYPVIGRCNDDNFDISTLDIKGI